jgi:hypothetical protein
MRTIDEQINRLRSAKDRLAEWLLTHRVAAMAS